MTSTDVNAALATLGGKEIAERDLFDFDSLVPAADRVDGATLDKDKARYIGVPFVITNITLRDGEPRNNKPTNYLSLEATVASQRALTDAIKRGILDPVAAMAIFPNDRIVFNDGSAGISRQAIAYLHHKGLVTVPEGPNDGPRDECRWDIYRAEWPDFDPANPCPSFDVLWHAPRGLRVSNYEYGSSGKKQDTYYLA